MKLPSRPRKGFTLVELLTVIAIIGILAAILFPAINGVLDIARRAAAQNNCQQIAKSYQTYANSTSNPRGIRTSAQGGSQGSRANGVAQNINDVAFILATKGNMNEAKLWFISTDNRLSGPPPRSVVEGDPSTVTNVSGDFASCEPKAWAFAVGLPPGSPPSSTPLLWTYGLATSGKWSPQSPWLGKGGHIGFMDGHVEWFEELVQGDSNQSLTVYPTNGSDAGQSTANIEQAIPNGNAGGRPAQIVNMTGNSN